MAKDSPGSRALVRRPGASVKRWRGDDHKLQLEAAAEAGLTRAQQRQTELDLYTEGFAGGITLDDALDGGAAHPDEETWLWDGASWTRATGPVHTRNG